MTLKEALRQNAELQAAPIARDGVIAELEAANAELRERIGVLEERLGQNSTNSSKPPVVGWAGGEAAAARAQEPVDAGAASPATGAMPGC